MISINDKTGKFPVNWQGKKEKRKKHSELRAQTEAKMIEKGTVANGKKKNGRFSIIDQRLTSTIQHNPQSTLSIAVPCSILRNVPSDRQAVQLVGQIARLASIFKVNEIIVFDDGVGLNAEEKCTTEQDFVDDKIAERTIRLLEYCECPQYLRKLLFERHPDLQFAGLLYPLTTPHHYKHDEEDWTYREGVVSNRRDPVSKCSLVNVGLSHNIVCDKRLKPGVRVTVQKIETDDSNSFLSGKIVSPSMPFNESGIYWGYRVRFAKSAFEVISSSTFNEKYDLIIGTSDRGIDVDHICEFKPYKHALVVFGGLYGLEVYFKPNEQADARSSAEHFDFYLNTCPNQGTRTIRTEEAISITLSSLRPLLKH